MFDAIELMSLSALSIIKQKIEMLEHRMFTHPLHKDASLESLYGLCEQKAKVNILHLYTEQVTS